MTSRREFLQAAAISGLPVIASSAGTVALARTRAPARIDVQAVVIDERFAQARSLGSRLADAGAPVLGIPEGDITDIWLREIGPLWRQQPATLAGLTARPALFCLEQLAVPHGLRVVFHAEHVVHPDGRTTHSVLRSSQDTNFFVRALDRAGTLWPARIADAIRTHKQGAGRARFGLSDAALEPVLPGGAQLLTSWIIAAA